MLLLTYLLISILEQPVSSPLLSFIPNSITATLHYELLNCQMNSI